jgi:hypothetical protein
MLASIRTPDAIITVAKPAMGELVGEQVIHRAAGERGRQSGDGERG